MLAGSEDERVARDWAATRVGALVLTKGSEGLVADDHRAGSLARHVVSRRRYRSNRWTTQDKLTITIPDQVSKI